MSETRFDIEAFVDPDTETIRMYAAGNVEKGDPCIEVPLDREVMLAWAYVFMRLADPDSDLSTDGDPFHLQGCFSTLNEEGE